MAIFPISIHEPKWLNILMKNFIEKEDLFLTKKQKTDIVAQLWNNNLIFWVIILKLCLRSFLGKNKYRKMKKHRECRDCKKYRKYRD